MGNSKVSVIIPTYNQADLLSRAIQSVLNQTFKDFELIIVDDGSTDNTKKVVEQFQRQDPRIKYIWQENSGGPAKPKNTGIKHAKGEYIAFLDHDDEWLPEKLERQIELFRNSDRKNLGFVGCNVLDVDNNKIIRSYKISKTRNTLKRLLKECFIHSSSSVIIKRSVIKEIGLFDENFKVSDDWDMWIRLAKKYSFDFIDKPLVKHYIHGKNITRSISYLDKIRELEHLLEKHQFWYKKFPIIYTKKIRTIGTMYVLENNMKIARKYFTESIKIAPYYVRNYFNLFISLFGANCYKKLLFKKKKLIQRLGVLINKFIQNEQ